MGHEVDDERLKGGRYSDDTKDSNVQKLEQAKFTNEGENLINMRYDLHRR